MLKFSTREAVAGDVPALLDIYNDVIVASAATFDSSEQTLDQRSAWFSEHKAKYPLVVAETGGRVVGYACLSDFRDKPAYSKSVERALSTFTRTIDRMESVPP